MAPKARKSNKARRSAGGPKKSVSIEMVRGAVAALGDRNGSTINAIFNYLVRTKKVSPNSRTLVILAVGRACREGSMAKRSPKNFVLQAGGKRKSPKRGKRKAKRARKSTAKSAGKRRRRRQRKRRSLKKKAKRSTKRRNRKAARKTKKTRKARRSRKPASKAYKRPAAKAVRRRPVRRAAKRINYRE